MCTVLTGQAIEDFRIMTLYRALSMQARGLRLTRVSATVAARRSGYVGRTAKALLADMERKHPELAAS